MKVGSLFSGMGGIDIALEQSGMKTTWQCEIDKGCQRVLAHHWPGVKRYEDVKEIGKHNIETVQLICGGFPCQDLSVAGRRAGLAGERSGLWFEFERIVGEIAPQWVLIENVPGLLSSNRGEDMAAILSGLEKLGYICAWRILDAQYFGVPQRRRRVFIVGSLGNFDCAKVLFESTCGCGDIAPSRKKRENIAKPIGGGSQESRRGFRNDLDNDTYVPVISPTLRSASDSPSAHGKNCGTDRGALVAYALNRKKGNRFDGESETFVCQQVQWASGGGEVLNDTAQSLRSGAEHNYQFVAETVGSLMANAATERKHGDGGISSLDQYLTGHIQPVNTMQVRRLTPLECLRLQGFPDNWLDLDPPLSDSAKYRMTGNAVAVPVLKWIGERIMEADKG